MLQILGGGTAIARPGSSLCLKPAGSQGLDPGPAELLEDEGMDDDLTAAIAASLAGSSAFGATAAAQGGSPAAGQPVLLDPGPEPDPGPGEGSAGTALFSLQGKAWMAGSLAVAMSCECLAQATVMEFSQTVLQSTVVPAYRDLPVSY